MPVFPVHMAHSSLRVVEVLAAAKRSIELNDRKPSIPGSLRKTDFGGVEQLLRLQHRVVAGKATPIVPSCNGDRFGTRGPWNGSRVQGHILTDRCPNGDLREERRRGLVTTTEA